MKINLGSYLYPKEGYVNVDIKDWDGVDVVADLNTLPWPWRDAAACEVLAYDIIEHLGKLSKVEILSELARIAKTGARVTVRVPSMYHPSSLQSIQHAHSFYLDSFERNYAQPYFHLTGRSVVFRHRGREIPFIFPFRFLIRMAGRLGFIHAITFRLERI